jgi:hypothetical protein
VESAVVRLSELKIGTIINTSSGGCDSESEEEMLKILKGAGIGGPTIWSGTADQIERSFAEAAAQN